MMRRLKTQKRRRLKKVLEDKLIARALDARCRPPTLPISEVAKLGGHKPRRESRKERERRIEREMVDAERGR